MTTYTLNMEEEVKMKFFQNVEHLYNHQLNMTAIYTGHYIRTSWEP